MATTPTAAPTIAPASAIEKKLDPQIALALKQSRGELPTAGPGAVMPNIPIRDATRMLVDVSVPVTQNVLDHFKAIGAQVSASSVLRHTVRAMVPITEIDGLAAREDVQAITPATLSDSSTINAAPPVNITR